MMTSADAGVQSEGFGQVGRVVVPDVEEGVVRARSEEVAARGPTAAISEELCLAREATCLRALTQPV